MTNVLWKGLRYCAERRCIGCLFYSAGGWIFHETGQENFKERETAMSVSLYGNLFFVVIEPSRRSPDLRQCFWTPSMTASSFSCCCRRFFLIPLLQKPSDEKIPLRSYADGDGISGVIKADYDDSGYRGIDLQQYQYSVSRRKNGRVRQWRGLR